VIPELVRRQGDCIVFWCPGCRVHHAVDVKSHGATYVHHDKTPVLSKVTLLFRRGRQHRCTFRLLGGRIHYGPGCTNGWSGQSMQMVPMRLHTLGSGAPPER